MNYAHRALWLVPSIVISVSWSAGINAARSPEFLQASQELTSQQEQPGTLAQDFVFGSTIKSLGSGNFVQPSAPFEQKIKRLVNDLQVAAKLDALTPVAMLVIKSLVMRTQKAQKDSLGV